MKKLLLIVLLVLPLPSLGSKPIILVFGDSLSAGYGMSMEKAWPSLLQNKLVKLGHPYHVINNSISGETTLGGLQRLPTSINKYRPKILIIELGANDGLRGLPLGQIENNLRKMIELGQLAGANVLISGMQLPPNYGAFYIQRFNNIFKKLSSEYRTAYLPFLLDGVADKREWMQKDNLHPTAEGQPKILDNVWQVLHRQL